VVGCVADFRQAQPRCVPVEPFGPPRMKELARETLIQKVRGDIACGAFRLRTRAASSCAGPPKKVVCLDPAGQMSNGMIAEPFIARSISEGT